MPKEQSAMCSKLFILIAMLMLLCSAGAKADDFVYAYCPLGEGYVFLYGSVAGFQVLANLKCGEKLTVVDTSDKDRARVRTASGKEGFVFKYTISTVPFGTQPQPNSCSACNSLNRKPRRPRMSPINSQNHTLNRSHSHRGNQSHGRCHNLEQNRGQHCQLYAIGLSLNYSAATVTCARTLYSAARH